MSEIQARSLFDFGEGDVDAVAMYNSQRISFQVSSHALSFASPVWEKFLFPPFHRLTDETEDLDEEMNISFTEDDGNAILLLLRIAHLQFNKVPADKELPYELLLQVAILCDQYDCVQLVRPWLPTWMKSEETEAEKSGQERWLLIAWVFGREDIFNSLAARLACEVSLSERGDCLSKDGHSLSDLMPPDIIDSILDVRSTTIVRLLALPYNFLASHDASSPSTCKAKTTELHHMSPYIPKTSQVQCKAVIYGSLIHELQRCSLWPIKGGKEIAMSVDDLVEVICSLQISTLPDVIHTHPRSTMSAVFPRRNVIDLNYKGREPTITSHYGCSAHDFKAEVTKILWAMPSPVKESHRRHMQAALNLEVSATKQNLPDIQG